MDPRLQFWKSRTPPPPSGDEAANRAVRLQIRRQILQLTILILGAAAAFFVTRAVAAANRGMNLRDAAEWYRRGEHAVQEHRLDDAIEAFRRASARDRGERRYALALARTLALNGDAEAARSALLTLREASPEDVDLNLQLARLAAERADVTEALRFYRTVLYSPWTAEHEDTRRSIRLELIRFLLAHDRVSQALSELIALSSSLPPDPAGHLEAARLFAEAGDQTHALRQYQQALELSPDNADALAGAGGAAYALGDYALAHRFLRRVPANREDVKGIKPVVELVLSRNPLAARLSSAERRRRFTEMLSYAGDRLSGCIAEGAAGAPAPADGASLRDELADFVQQVPARGPLEQETIEAGMDLVGRIEHYVTRACGPATPLDTALLLIGRAHAEGAR